MCLREKDQAIDFTVRLQMCSCYEFAFCIHMKTLNCFMLLLFYCKECSTQTKYFQILACFGFVKTDTMHIKVHVFYGKI